MLCQISLFIDFPARFLFHFYFPIKIHKNLQYVINVIVPLNRFCHSFLCILLQSLAGRNNYVNENNLFIISTNRVWHSIGDHTHILMRPTAVATRPEQTSIPAHYVPLYSTADWTCLEQKTQKKTRNWPLFTNHIGLTVSGNNRATTTKKRSLIEATLHP